MGYDSKHVELKTPQEGYNIIAEEYQKYHTLLNNFDKGLFKRFLPRGDNEISIIDLGAGDGRIFEIIKNLKYQRYVACDIADKLLKKHPGTKNIEKHICNLEEELPFEDNSFDLATSFFVLEHINNIDNLFKETYRILKIGGRWIIGHFLQRHEFTRKKGKDIFKINFYNHRIQDLEKIAQNHFFDIDICPVKEGENTIGYIIILNKTR